MFTKKCKTNRERITKQTSGREVDLDLETKVTEFDFFDQMKKKS